jgi:hypothetical protein
MSFVKTIGTASLVGAAFALTTLPASPSAQAMPNIVKQTQLAPNHDATLQRVVRRGRNDGRRWGRHDRDWRRRHWRRHHRYYDDWNPGAYIALGILGALVNQGLSESEARSAMQRCDERFRSFEPDTGLYTTYGGEKRLCPYLR